MHPTDLSAEPSAKAEPDLNPDPFDKLRPSERRREITSILAAGVLRLHFGRSSPVSDAAGPAVRLSRPAPASG